MNDVKENKRFLAFTSSPYTISPCFVLNRIPLLALTYLNFLYIHLTCLILH